LKYADLVYAGQWFTPLREALDAFFDKTQETVTGSVKLMLYKGNLITVSSSSVPTLFIMKKSHRLHGRTV
jgi:argininosuccinate synthase